MATFKIFVCLKQIIDYHFLFHCSAVASMGQGGAIAPPPNLGRCPPPIGSCPGNSRKPAFGNGAIAS